MKSIFTLVLLLTFAAASAPANARMECNHDPVCQAKRDGVSVSQAKAADRRAPRKGLGSNRMSSRSIY
jgi:hypothetical protein